MTNEQKNYKFIYRKDYAMEMIALGHQVFTTMPNPQNNKLIMWVFIDDATYESDFQALKRGGARID